MISNSFGSKSNVFIIMKSITVSKNWDLGEVFTITESILLKSFWKKEAARVSKWKSSLGKKLHCWWLLSVWVQFIWVKLFLMSNLEFFSKETKFTAHFTVVTEIPYKPFFENVVVELQKYKIINISRIRRFRKKVPWIIFVGSDRYNS